MIPLFVLLSGLWSQSPDSAKVPTSSASDTSIKLVSQAFSLDSVPAPKPQAQGIPQDTTRILPPPSPPGPTAPSGPVMESGPVGPDISSGPVVTPAPKPATPAIPSAAGPVGPAVPGVVVPPATFGPSGANSSNADSSALHRSTASAMGLSLLLPGMGHRWIGRSSRAPVYHALDLLGLTAVVVSWQMGSRSLESATEIANRHAGASLGDDPDRDLLTAMRNYRSRRPQAGRHDSYDEAMLLSGKSTTWQFPDDQAHDWDWGSRENPDNDAHLRSFESQLRTWRTSQVALYSAAGTMVVLRLAAALDVLRLNRSSAARAGIALETNPIPGGMESKMAVNF